MLPSSTAGIALLLALCAAAWFSGGSPADNLRGMLPLAVWLLPRGGSLLLNQLALWQEGGALPGAAPWPGGKLWPGTRPRRTGRLAAGSTDWLAPYPGGTARRTPARSGGAAAAASVSRQGALFAISSMSCEFIVYCGIALGGARAGWPGMWPEAIAAVIAIGARETVRACRDPGRMPARGGQADNTARGTPAGAAGLLDRLSAAGAAAISVHVIRALRVLRAFTRAVLDARSAGRAALAGAALLYHGPRVALFAVLVLTVTAAAAGLLRRTPSAPSDRTSILIALRDDGALVRRAGRLVQGNMPPLAGAVAGLAATALLASIGMADTIAIVKLAPLVAMLLAAPGASHRHTGRRDWLVPVAMQLSQYIYLAELGLSSAVPRPAVFALCALTAVRYLQLAADADRGVIRGTRTGWEGRLFLLGFGAMAGVAAVAYVAVAAYLGVLICNVIATRYLRPGEESRR